MSVFCSAMLFKSINSSLNDLKSKDLASDLSSEQEKSTDVHKICDNLKVDRKFDEVNLNQNDFFVSQMINSVEQ